MKEEKAKETLGKRLKRERDQKGLPLEEVFKKTRIHIKVLNAIEDDKIESLTTLFYARSFVKSYAQFLGIGEDEQVRQFLSGAKRPAKQVLFLEGTKEKEILKVLKIFKIILIGIIAVIFLFFSLSIVRSFVKKQRTKHVAAGLVPAPSGATTRGAATNVVPAKTKFAKKEGLNLTVLAKEDTYLQLKSDGRIIFKGILAKNKKETWKAKGKFELSVGNAGTLELSLNGKALGAPGKKGEVIKNIVITKEGIRIR